MRRIMTFMLIVLLMGLAAPLPCLAADEESEETWQELMDQADVLLDTDNPDSAAVLLDRAMVEARSDEATAGMMSNLYARQDESLPDAMRRVQLEKIMELHSAGMSDHPFTWGAFIALGDWR